MSIECSVVIPLCNEEENLPQLHGRLMATLRPLAVPFEIIYVDDGSTDRTAELIRTLNRRNPCVKGLFLSRNFGHQAAICAGLEVASGRTVVTMDGDLQDPPEVIPELRDKWGEGFQVVYARRRRRHEGPLKQLACHVFYRLLRRVSDVSIPLDTGDFALMDRQAVDQLNALPERARFIRGLRSWIGFAQAEVEYDRDPRTLGTSKYTFARLARLGLDGLFGFSDSPLRMITWLGLGVGTLASAAVLAVLCGWLAIGLTGPAIAVLIGLQLASTGMLGEYVGRIACEVRGRPLYITRERLGFSALPRSVPRVVEFLATARASKASGGTRMADISEQEVTALQSL